jgi:hypothetical protein
VLPTSRWHSPELAGLRLEHADREQPGGKFTRIIPAVPAWAVSLSSAPAK